MTRVLAALLSAITGLSPAVATGSILSRSGEIYEGWLKMYDLDFTEAHRIFTQWAQNHPADSLGPASDAAADLFSELTRLGVLESELFVNYAKFAARNKLQPDPQVRLHFRQHIEQAGRLAYVILQTSPPAGNALFVNTLTRGL